MLLNKARTEILLTLKTNGHSLTDLSRTLKKSYRHVSLIRDELVEKDLVTQIRDKSGVHMILTDKGKRLVALLSEMNELLKEVEL